MSDKKRRPGRSVIERLKRFPQLFSFLQIMRILERDRARENARNHSTRAQSQNKEIVSSTDFRPPRSEPVRIKGHHNLSFPGQEVSGLAHTNDDKWELEAGFIGLAGAMGPLPFHYTELLLERQKEKDQALAAFLDLFVHRSTTLFWRAATKYRLPLEYERARASGNKNAMDKHTEMLLSLIGLSPRIFKNTTAIEHETLIYYGGLFSQGVTTSANLQQILAAYFDVPVKINELSGDWCEVLPTMLCQLPSPENPKGQNNCLGRTSMSGQKSWLAQNKVEVVVGPLDQTQHHQFAPGSPKLAAMQELSSLYLGMENSCDFSIQVKQSEMPNQLKLSAGNSASLGWNTRLPQSNGAQLNSDAVVSIPVSGSRP
jgi:type VI secretion system protein ImpH